MIITHEIREYIIEDGDVKYSVRYNVGEDKYFVHLIVANGFYHDRNSIEYVEVSEEKLNKIKECINNK